MLKNKKLMLILGLEVFLVILSIVLIILDLGEYAIISGALVIFVSLFLYNELKDMFSTEATAYKNKVNKILKTYNPIVISTNEFPNLKDKSVLPIEKIEDLLDAQAEIREPIYYIRKDDATIFFIINNESVLYTFIKIEGVEETNLEKEFKAKKDGLNLESVKDSEKEEPKEENKEDDEDFKTVPIKVHEINKATEEEDDDFKTVPLELPEDLKQEDDEDFKTIPIEMPEEVKDDDEDFKTIPIEIPEEVKNNENSDDEVI